MARKHDWYALKKEFMQGKWLTLISFLREKDMESLRKTHHLRGWVKEKNALKQKALDIAKQGIVERDSKDITSIRERQARLARFLQLKGLATIEEKEPETIDEARRLVIGGMEQERKALGMDLGKGGVRALTQINIEAQTNLDKLVEKLDYEGILKLIAELKRERKDSPGEATRPAGESAVEEGETI